VGFYNVVNAPSMQSGQPEDVSQVLANFQAIAAILNGQLDNSNVATAAAIAYSKLALTGSIVNTDIATSAGIAWQKLNYLPVARIAAGGTTVTSAEGEKQLPINYETDNANLGTIVSNDYRIDVAGTYLIFPSMYTWNLGGGSNQVIRVRQNPAGANAKVTEVNAQAGIATAGAERWIAGVHTAYFLAVNDVIRLTGINSEAVARNIDGHLILWRIG